MRSSSNIFSSSFLLYSIVLCSQEFLKAHIYIASLIYRVRVAALTSSSRKAIITSCWATSNHHLKFCYSLIPPNNTEVISSSHNILHLNNRILLTQARKSTHFSESVFRQYVLRFLWRADSRIVHPPRTFHLP